MRKQGGVKMFIKKSEYEKLKEENEELKNKIEEVEREKEEKEKGKHKTDIYCKGCKNHNCKNIRETEMTIGGKRQKVLYCSLDVPCEGY